MNFIYTVDPNVDEPIMTIDKHIGFDEKDGMGIDGSQFLRELLSLDSMGKRRVQVWINSPGGSVMDGYNICMGILNTKCKVDTYCRGMAASIAGVIFLCGRTKYMADYGIVMMHDPSGGENSQALNKIKTSLATLIANRCDKTTETINAIMSKETFMDASEAIDLGVCDEIELSTDANKGRLSKVQNNIPEFWKEAKAIMNSALKEKSQLIIFDNNKEKNMSDFKKINNKLGLMDEANADSTMKAIDDLRNKAEVADKKAEDAVKSLAAKEAELKKAKDDMDAAVNAAKATYDLLNAEFIKTKAEMDKVANEAKVKEAEMVKNSIEVYLTAKVKDGAIPNVPEKITSWRNRLEKDFTGTKEIIDELEITKKAPDFSVITDKNDPFSGKKSYATMEEQNDHIQGLIGKHMADVKNKK
jgi:ATP-dependent Clp protease protease subunit